MGVLHLCFLFDVLVILYNRGNKAHLAAVNGKTTKRRLFCFCFVDIGGSLMSFSISKFKEEYENGRKSSSWDRHGFNERL